LCRYYEILADDSSITIPRVGYSSAKVSFALVLSASGELINILDLRNKAEKGNKLLPVQIIVPEQRVRSGTKIMPYFMCDNNKYMLGVDKKESADRLINLFNSFMNFHVKLLDNVPGIAARAVINFLKEWDPKNAKEHPVLQKYYDDIAAGATMVFKLEGERGYIHELTEIKKCWEDYIASENTGFISQCLVTGRNSVIAQVHPKIKGVEKAQSAGASIVSFNFDAVESYGKKQSFNSPVSEYAAFAYTTALNYMLGNQRQKIQIGDATTVFWAESPKSIYIDIAAELLNMPGDDAETDENTNAYKRDPRVQNIVAGILKKVAEGKKITEVTEEINPETKFYILGLSPNNARISIRFFHVDSFEGFVEKMAQHYNDMEIIKRDFEVENIPIWRMLRELKPKTSTEQKVPPGLSSAIMRSILNGTSYPSLLFNMIMSRIRADHEVNYVRAAITKAYLLRNARIHNKNNLKEVLTVGLNEQSTNTAYLLGRLFAVLEKAQQDANPDINTTIKDRYFASACATPASVFPILLRLSQHHISKSDYGLINERRIGEIMNGLNSFPSHLSLEEQGIFMLGYYHQKHALYQKKEN